MRRSPRFLQIRDGNASGGDLPKIVATDTKQVVFDLLEHGFHGDGLDGNDVLWAPDSQRFAVNYIPPHAHHTTYKRVAFYQLRGDKWIALLYAPCYDDSHLVKTAFLFTLKFDDAGWKIIKTHQMSKKEIEEFE